MKLEKAFIRHLTVPPEDQVWGLYVTEIGYREGRVGERRPGSQAVGREGERGEKLDILSVGRTLDDFQWVFISGGAGEFESEGHGIVPVQNASLILIPPGCRHRYHPLAGSCWNEYWLNFNGEFARMLLNSGAIKPHPAVRAVSVASIRGQFDRLLDRLQATRAMGAVEKVNRVPSGTAQLVAADLFQLLAQTAGPVGAIDQTVPVEETGESLVAEAVAIIWSEGRESITVEELAEEMLVARRTLERAFRRKLAHGIHDEILLCRLDRTTRLLADRSLSIEQVAAESGFGTVRSLRRAFVAARGMSPQAYRNLIWSDPKAA